ncbi:MAG: hypothetical protein MI924_36145 [Chloroflexales bacterium]|nr:hypothetical protein [Chloroflexales bacterium]
MANGTTILLPVTSDEHFTPITADDSYFQIALYAAQAFITMPSLSQTAYLICSTEVGSAFLPDHQVRSIHKVETVQKNRPCLLGLSVALTDWLPAVSDKTIRVTLKLLAMRDRPFGKLTDAMDNLGLSSALSLIAPQIGTGVTIAAIAGKMIGSVLEEGKEQHMLELTADLPVHSLRSGYWAALAPDTPGDIPTALRLRPGGRLDDPRAPFSERNTYALLRIRARERRGEEAARTSAWRGILQDGLRQLRRLDAFSSDQERMKARAVWKDTLERAERMAEADHSFLLSEIRQIFQVATQAALRLQQPAVLSAGPFESTERSLFDADFQRLLGVRDPAALEGAVEAYQAALARAAAADAAE